MTKVYKFIHFISVGITIVFALLLAACTVAHYISPKQSGYLLFLSYIFQYIYLVCLLVALYWFIRQRVMLLVPLIPLMMGFSIFSSCFNFYKRTVKTDSSTTIKVASYNVRLFDLYNWTKNKETRSKIMRQLDTMDVDVICFQEFFTNDNPKAGFENIDTLKQILDMRYVHYLYTSTLNKTEHFGLVTFSKFPIITTGEVKINSRHTNGCIFTDIYTKGEIIRVYNVHLESMRFDKKDYKLVNKLEEGVGNKNDLEVAGSLSHKIRHAAKLRASQAEIIHKHVLGCKRKLLLVGDFNDTPASYTYRVLSYKLDDSFKAGNIGFGLSYTQFWPGFRIDYILHSKNIKTLDYKTIKNNLSDHYPVIATIAF